MLVRQSQSFPIITTETKGCKGNDQTDSDTCARTKETENILEYQRQTLGGGFDCGVVVALLDDVLPAEFRTPGDLQQRLLSHPSTKKSNSTCWKQKP
jgi:hypothetical protein